MSGRLNPGAGSFVPGGGFGGQRPPQGPPGQEQGPPGQGYPYGQQGQFQQPYYGQQQPPYGAPYQQPPYGQYAPPGAGGYGGGYGQYQPPHPQGQYAPPPRGFVPPQVQQHQSQSQPLPAPPSAESISTGPAKTISLNIGGAKPAPPAAPPPAAPRKEAETAPAPAPSIKINIGGSSSASAPKPAAPASSSSSSTPTPAPNAPASSTPAPAATVAKAKDFNFTSDKAKTDVNAVISDTLAAADEETLKDLYGDDSNAVDDNVKSHMNVVFVGHVDAGKSTLGGQLLYLCGMVDKRTLEKYEREAKEAGRESWYLSWALDSTTQERAKGKTVEVGRAYFETDKRRYTILDAPGHKTFVPSMITGAAQADVAILVISARKGEFETGFEKGGQTREHIMLVKTAGVSKVIVVINKMDDPTVQWSEERYNEIVSKLTPFVKAAGFNPKTDATFIPISAFTGANIKEKADSKVAPWLSGGSLLQFLDELPLLNRKVNGPVMMPISEKFKDLGTVVIGKLESGHIRKGDSLLLMPNKVPVEVTSIQSEMESEMNTAYSGDNVRIRLRGVEDEDVSPGFVLTSVARPVRAVRRFEAQLAILDHKNIICAGYSAVMHVHTLAEEVSLVALLHYFDKKTGRKSKKPPQFAKKGQKIIALIETTAPVCVERFADYPQLGRFTLRDEGKTIAIGKVTRLVEAAETSIEEGVANIALGNVGNTPTA